jgi:flagellar basal-body rod modification protein FlgD
MMSDNSIVSTGLLSDLSVQQKTQAKAKNNEMGQDTFLKLMITQMNNQNPLEPQSNSEFVAQLAQFSSVEGIDKLNSTLDTMAASFQSSQALQASSLVGRTVKVNSDTAKLDGSGVVAGTIDLPFSTSDLKINIYNEANELVGQELLGPHSGGTVNFAWQGEGSDGEQMPQGKYRFEAVGMYDGQPLQLNTALSANVDSVTVGANGTIVLNAAGVGPMPVFSVREIL